MLVPVSVRVSPAPDEREAPALGVCPACSASLALDPRAATAGCPYCGAVPDPTGTLPLTIRTCRRCGLTGYPEDWVRGKLRGARFIFHVTCPPEPDGEAT